MNAGVKKAERASILLIDDNACRRTERALVLATHGYEVECAESYDDAVRQCRVNKPDLLLIGVTHAAESPSPQGHGFICGEQQALGFLLNEGQHLCAVEFNGKLLLAREGPDDFVARVAMLLDRRGFVETPELKSGRLQ